MKNPIDLHMHSTASDGSDSIPKLLEQLQNADIHTFAVTDHDTIDGMLEMSSLVPSDMHFISGVELSCITPHKRCHILGYAFDPQHPSIQEALNLGKKLRQEKLQCRVHFLQTEYGITLTKEEADWLYSQNSPGKPHLGQIMMQRGFATDLSTAIEKYINPCKVGNDRIDSEIAIQAIRKAGGIAVWAHPFGGENTKKLTREVFSAQLEYLISAGIQGLECYYSRYTQKDIQQLLSMADQHNLLVSGGSDYHGKNKKDLYPGKLSADEVTVDVNSLSILSHL